ncbi:MAG: DNA-processing protein DprA [Clostridia bacterium]
MEEEKEEVYLLWFLLTSGTARVRNGTICKAFSSFKDIYYNKKSKLQTLKIASKYLLKFENKDLSKAREVLETVKQKQMRIISFYDNDYPAELKDISPVPVALFMLGKYKNIKNSLKMAVVGARKCTDYGKNTAYTLSRELASKNVVIVSGMAEGVDAQAHKGAIDAGGYTIAVLGTGADIPYPNINKDLYDEILDNGIILSEYLPGTPPAKYTFPERNRIVSGLAKGILVVESKLRGGSLITATAAQEQNRELFVVPGPIDSPESLGANRLINQGGKAVSDIYDIIEDYMPEVKTEMVRKRKDGTAHMSRAYYSDLDRKERDIAYSELDRSGDPCELVLRVVSKTPLSIDDIIKITGLLAQQVSSSLMMLQVQGKVIGVPGGRYKSA